MSAFLFLTHISVLDIFRMMRQLNNIHFDTIQGASARQSKIVSSASQSPLVSQQKDESNMTKTNEQNDELVKQVERTIKWMSDILKHSNGADSNLKVGLASTVQKLSSALGQEMDKDVEKLLYRPIDRDKARVIQASKKNDMYTPPNAWQKIK